MLTCKTATPLQVRQDTKLKIQRKVPNNLPQETNKQFFEILSVRWENRLWRWTRVVENDQNQYFCGKPINFFSFQPESSLLIFSPKYASSSVLTGNNHPRPRKILYVE